MSAFTSFINLHPFFSASSCVLLLTHLHLHTDAFYLTPANRYSSANPQLSTTFSSTNNTFYNTFFLQRDDHIKKIRLFFYHAQFQIHKDRWIIFFLFTFLYLPLCVLSKPCICSLMVSVDCRAGKWNSRTPSAFGFRTQTDTQRGLWCLLDIFRLTYTWQVVNWMGASEETVLNTQSSAGTSGTNIVETRHPLWLQQVSTVYGRTFILLNFESKIGV